ncbi:MAG: hypothetical protein HZA58_00110 [Acidimicrobiia bacterium]|nr:hypothetical protein [Acidimicrobiia bacterium]
MSLPGAPRDGRILLGPCLTEREFERRVHATPGSVRGHDFLLRIDGALSLEPAYPAFQLDGDVVRADLAWLVTLLKKHMPDLTACDWLVRPNAMLAGLSPLEWLNRGLGLEETARAIPGADGAPHSRGVGR